jgi:hypothetical protein
MNRVQVCAMTAVGCLSLPNLASAQTTGLINQMTNLFVQSVVLSQTPGGRGVVVHEPVFATDTRITSVTGLVNQISGQIATQVATFPLGSSSGGFTYAYDPALGTFSRSSDTFGPAFAERAVTAGKGKISLGMNYVHSGWTSLDGREMQNGAIKFYLDHQPLTGAGAYVQGDEIQAALDLKLSSDTVAFLANFGVTDRFDVGLAVPIVHNSMDLTYHATILDFSTHITNPTVHLFTNGSKQQDFTSQGSASGIGDVVVRAKYVLMRQGPNGLAAEVDLTLPSGNSDNMLGTGAAQAKFFVIGSGAVGDRLAPHINIGYTAAGSGASKQFNYVGGVELLASPRATVVADVVGRTFFDSLRLNDTNVTHTFRQSDTGPLESTVLNTVSVTSGNLNSVLGAIGVKLNPGGSFLVSAHVLFPLTESGLRSKVTPVIGIDYAF